jgi:two-component sensor histidine kinase
VKNNLQIVYSLLDLQSARIEDTQVQDMLRDSQNRIRSMALIHQTLYQSKDFS